MPLELVEWLLITQSKPTNKGALKVSVSSSGLKCINVSFDDHNLVANAGLILVSTLSESLGLCELIEEKVSLAGRVGEQIQGGRFLAWSMP
ncbi:MAG: hypothetical protein M1374_05185 [Firmicutes bacterium]|nr:hypothetical protein [Bacillota bacterium]